MKQLVVGIKYCGHCNPQLDGPDLIAKLKELDPSIKFVHWDSLDKDLLLIFSGCSADCVSRPPFNGPIIHIAGSSLERHSYTLQELPYQIIKAIKEKGGAHLD